MSSMLPIGAVACAVAVALALGFALRRHQAFRAARRALAAREVQLGEAERRLEALVDAQDLVVSYDLDGRLTSIGARGAHLLGLAPDQAERLHLRDFFDIRYLPLLLVTPEGSTLRDRFEAPAQTREGETLWFDLRLRTRLEDGRPVGGELCGIDISALKRAAQVGASQGGVVYALSQAILLEGTVRSVLETLSTQVGFDYCELWEVDERYDLLRVREVWHDPVPDVEAYGQRARKRTLTKGSGIAGRVWALETPVFLPELAPGDLGPDDTMGGVDFRSALGFPLAIGRARGAVVLLSVARSVARMPAAELLGVASGLISGLAERQRGEEQLKTSEMRHRAVLECALDCVVSTDAEGRILEFNPAAERTFQHARADVLGRPVDEILVPEELRQQHREGFAAFLRTQVRHIQGRIETTALRADGSQVPIELAVLPVLLGDRPIFTAFLRDISDRKELERFKDELVSTVSHELRTPLASIRGFVELLLTREFSREQQQQFLNIVDAEIKRLTRLINDFLDLQRLERGDQIYDMAPHDLVPVLRDCASVVSGTGSGHQFEVDLPAQAVTVQMDPDRIRQVVMNLLSNAVKFSPDGGTVSLSVAVNGDTTRVSVRDEGIGMEPAVVRKLFSKFYRADSSATRKIEGTGLGLSLVREIVTAHGGEVWVDSEPGQGSCFHFKLPVCSEKPKAEAE
jgi:PAS domain S-box-containing protein